MTCSIEINCFATRFLYENVWYSLDRDVGSSSDTRIVRSSSNMGQLDNLLILGLLDNLLILGLMSHLLTLIHPDNWNVIYWDNWAVGIYSSVWTVKVTQGKHEGVKKAHSRLGVPNHHQECYSVQRHDNTSYIWGCYHMKTNHTIYVRRGTISTVYFISTSRTNKTGLLSEDTRNSRRKRPMLLVPFMQERYFPWVLPLHLGHPLTNEYWHNLHIQGNWCIISSHSGTLVTLPGLGLGYI